MIILAVLLLANSYAWFIFINNVSNSVDVHVRAWKIDFDDGTSPVTETVDIVVNDVYPGMTTYEKPINAHNYSDVPANVEYKVLEARILEDMYITVEGRADRGETALSTDLTSAELVTMLETQFPFQIEFDMSGSTIAAGNGVATYTISVSWAYESGDDELDTLWGTRAYNYKQSYPNNACISLRVKIYITQAQQS